MMDAVLVDEVQGRETRAGAAAPSWILRFFPCLTDLAFLLPMAVLFTLLDGTRTLLADGDTGWHIRTGDWIVKHGRVPYRDIFSFTKPNDAWFAWEWGWDVLFSLIHRYWSLPGVVLANVVILGLVGVLLYRLVRKQAPNDIVAFVLTGIALCGSGFHWLARPHLLSFVFILSFLHLLKRADEGKLRALWWCPLLTLVWVNVHGSFFIGIFFLLTAGTANAVRDVVTQGGLRSILRAVQRNRIYFLSAIACLAVSFINPYSWHLHEHVISYLRDSKQLGVISEFQPLDFRSPLALCFEFFLALGACAVVDCFRRGLWAQAVLIVISAHLGLQSARNIPIFLFVAAPAAAMFLKICLEQGRNRFSRALLNLGRDFQSFERVERLPVLPITGMLLLTAALGSARITDFDKRDFPVQAAAVLGGDPATRVFTFDQWGDYLIYKFAPQRRVFVDGRSDFYGPEFGEKWLAALKAHYDWRTELNRYSIDTVLLKPDNALASVLKESKDWTPFYDDGTAILFRRKH